MMDADVDVMDTSDMDLDVEVHQCDPELCVLCGGEFDSKSPSCQVLEKGLATLKRISKERQENKLHADLVAMQTSGEPIKVHHACRRRFVDVRQKSNAEPLKKKLRSKSTAFDWKTPCFFCSCQIDRKHQLENPVRKVMTLECRNKMLERAEQRDDTWGDSVKVRLECCNDLVAEEAVYHSKCMSKFCKLESASRQVGRPVDGEKNDAFIAVCQWLEEYGDCELYTIQEVLERMMTLSKGEVYNSSTLKKKLKERYRDNIFFAELNGRLDVVCFRDMAYEMKKKAKPEKDDIIRAAAQIIKEELRGIEKSTTHYPSDDTIRSIEDNKNWIPPSLQLLLRYLVPSELKQVSIGQCITQAARPRSFICPVLFGLGVQLDKSFGSKWLIQNLHKFGFSISSDEVHRFKQSASLAKSTDPIQVEGGFVQWIADNVDHNLITLTGKGTFHGMGIISSSVAPPTQNAVIKRLAITQKAADFAKDQSIPIHSYHGSSKHGMLKIKLKPIKELQSAIVLPHETSYNLIWKSKWFLNTSRNLQANWSGFMQDITTSFSKPSKNKIEFLPIIDLNPGDESCIYSTLSFIIDQAKMLNVQTPSVTFDQPLWLKASGIISQSNLQVVCRFGGFHTLMSFLGSIGVMMRGSGLSALFAEVCAENTVQYIMSGKAVSRALRAHFLCEAALSSILLDMCIECDLLDASSVATLSESCVPPNGCSESDDGQVNFYDSQEYTTVKNALQNLTSSLAARSRTAALWLSYLDYVDLLKQFILAERISNWQLHLETTRSMLNLFAATGHANYAKCGRLYVQQMMELDATYPWLFEKFSEGSHAIRRSARHWSGLWSDLVIEQTLMRSIKTRGGLTRGRGMTDSVRHLWVKSMHSMAMIHEAMMSLSGANIISSEQHTDMSTSRQKRDLEDHQKLKVWLESRNPFNFSDEHLHSLSSGFVSDRTTDDINCDKAEELGAAIQKSFDGVNFTSAVIRKKECLKPLEALKNTVTIEKNNEYVSPKILFTRLTALAQREDDVESYFEYELAVFPPSLFKDGLMRKPDKPALLKTLLSKENCVNKDELSGEVQFVVDGGALLHRVRWVKGCSFGKIAELYVEYVQRHYGQRSYIIFDGYESYSTKTNEHSRRSGNNRCPNVDITEDTILQNTQDQFLTNTRNKATLIHFIARYLQRNGSNVTECEEDADTTIVSVALKVATNYSGEVVVVGDDTDIAVMLLYHWSDELADMIYYQERKQSGWSVRKAAQNLGTTREHVLFVHARSGCDTVSAPYGKGKASFWTLTMKNEQLQDISTTIMNDAWAVQKDVGNASQTIFSIMYGGKKDNLINLRYKKYMDMLCKGQVDPERLPPSPRAAFFHSLRAHLQIIRWKLLDEEEIKLKPEEWGWKLTDDGYEPITSDQVPAPESILKVIRCHCKESCSSNRCSCRRNALKCTATCANCMENECENWEHLEYPSESDSDLESGCDEEDEHNLFDLFL